MAKYGKLIEYTYAIGGRTEVMRTIRPTASRTGARRTSDGQGWEDMQDKGWILAKFLDERSGGSWVHSGQVRFIGNET